jgi:hypothetical protein
MNHIFAVLVTVFNFVPESLHLGGIVVSGHVVKHHQPSRPDQGRIHFPILSDPLISIVAVDKQEVNVLSSQQRFDPVKRCTSSRREASSSSTWIGCKNAPL